MDAIQPYVQTYVRFRRLRIWDSGRWMTSTKQDSECSGVEAERIASSSVLGTGLFLQRVQMVEGHEKLVTSAVLRILQHNALGEEWGSRLLRTVRHSNLCLFYG